LVKDTFDLYSLVTEETAQEAMQRLESDDLLLSEILWLLCEEQAISLKIRKSIFLKSLNGAVLESGLSALFEALTSFFRNPIQRKFMEGLAKVYREQKEHLRESVAAISLDAILKSVDNSDSTTNNPTVPDHIATPMLT
jgi:hypothetical protein